VKTFWVKVHPSSPKRMVKERGDYLEVWVKAPAEQGKANKELLEILAKYLGSEKENIKILQGWKKRKKLIGVKE